MPPKPKALTIGPGVQGIIDQIETNTAQAQSDAAESPGGVGLFGGAFKASSGFLADRFGDVASGVGYLFKGLDLSRRYVAQPSLGALIATRDGRWGDVGSVNDLRSIWEEADVNPLLRFAAEAAFDPLMYTGLGLWETSAMKFAKLAHPLVLSGAKSATGTGRIAEIFKNPARVIVGRTSDILKSERGFSPQAKEALRTLAGGVKSKPETRALLNTVGADAVRAGVIKEEQLRPVIDSLVAAGPDAYKYLQPGVFERLFEPFRLSRVFAPMDVLFENVWAAPFAALAPVIKPALGPTGKVALRVVDAAGGSFPLKQFLWLGKELGPAGLHDAYAAAGQGKLASWIVQPAPEALRREAGRIVASSKVGFAEGSARMRLSLKEQLEAIRLNQENIMDAIPLGPDMVSVLSRTLHLERMPDSVWMKMLGSKTEEQLFTRLQRHITDTLGEGLVGVPRIDKEALTPANKLWGWTQGLVNRWRPWVTSYNPSFQFLNVFSDLTERGGSALVVANGRETARYMVSLGYPAELTSHVADSMLDLFSKASSEGFPGQLARLLKRDGFTLAEGEKIAEATGVTQFGTREMGRSVYARFAHAATMKADQGAQLEIAYRGMSEGFLQRVLSADVDHPLFRLRKLVESNREAGLNPVVLDEVERLMGELVLRPKAALNRMARKFNYENILLSDIESSYHFRVLPPEAQDAFKRQFQTSLDQGISTRESMLRGADAATRSVTSADVLGAPIREAMAQQARFETIIDGVFAEVGITGLKGARTQTQEVMRKSLEGYASFLNAAGFDEDAVRFATDRSVQIMIASRQTDAVAYTAVAKAAQNNGAVSMAVLPTFEAWNQRTAQQIGVRLEKLAEDLDTYKAAMVAGDPTKAKDTLRQMARKHGDFAEFVTQPELPLPDMLLTQYKVTGERVWSQFVGEKYEMADALVAMFDSGRVLPHEVASLFNKGQSEVFRQGNIPVLREKWSKTISRISGNENIQMPLAGQIRMERQALRQEERDLRNQLRSNAAVGLNPEAEENLIVQGRIDEIGARVQDLADNPPTRPVSQFYLDLQNNYDLIGKTTIEAAARLMPENYRRILMDATNEVRERVITTGLNEVQDREGVKVLHELFEGVVNASGDKVTKQAVNSALRDSLSNEGMALMRSRMVDYTQLTNLHQVINGFLPFASFQLHLPGYLARTFQQRPGVIVAMNHFSQAAQDNFGVTGGASLGFGGFVFAPQLRFSFLPLLAGNNFVRKDDHPLNQLSDFLSAFGFSPGPNVQIAGDLANDFSEKVGFNRLLGIDQGAPEFRGGLIPQWRFIQDVTALMGIDGGRGLSVPFIGPSTDLREREVERVLAGRLGERLDELRAREGREPYPDEVNAIRESIMQNELIAARQEVAARDIASGLIPGLKAHDPEFERIREKAAMWMGLRGVESSSKDVVFSFSKLDKIQKAQLLREIPEFGDVMSIPPFQESGQEKEVRKAQESFFGNRDIILANTQREQRKLDAALENGNITPKQYRDMRSDLRLRMSAALTGLENNPDLQPFVRRERVQPTEPEEMAFTDFTKMEPNDANQNGIIDEEDMRLFFDARSAFLTAQPPWIQSYIRERREFSMTPVEREFTRTQSTLNQFFDIPKYVGLSTADGETADRVIADAQALARLQPGGQELAGLIMVLPGVSERDKLIALTALQVGRNPQRFLFWTRNPDLDVFYPDLKPANPFQ